MKQRVVAWIMLVVWVAAATYLGMRVMARVRGGDTLLTFIYAACFGCAVANVRNSWKTRRLLNEHRRTERDRERAGTGTTHHPSPNPFRPGGAGPDEGTRDDTLTLPESSSPTPFLATKYSRLLWVPGDHYLFGGSGMGKATQYGIVARARCLRVDPNEPHRIPDPDCECGFYAMAMGHREILRSDFVEIEVELGGRVIVHDDGYRAEWQHVLKILVPRLCFICDEKADALAVACDTGGTHQAMPFCASDIKPEYRVLNFEQISQSLGVPVEWREWE
jgi:hypothetical protein